MNRLYSLFGCHFLESLQFIDEKSVTLFETSFDQQVFEVKDQCNTSKALPDRYYCSVAVDYCSCDQFRTGNVLGLISAKA